MKKAFLLSLLALLIASCSNDELAPNNSSVGNGTLEQTNGFVIIKMRTATSLDLGSRGENDNKDYENGTEAENNVKRVRFYFFDEEDNAVAVHHNAADGDYNSYIDWYPTSEDVDTTGTSGGNESVIKPNETIEKVLSVNLGLNMLGETKPAKVLAILNITEDIVKDIEKATKGNQLQVLEDDDTATDGENTDKTVTINGPSLEELRSIVADYLTDDNFVMSNSVYLDNGIKYATDIDEGKISKEPDDETKAITIYVERVLARVDLGYDGDFFNKGLELNNGERIFKVGSYEVRDDPKDEVLEEDEVLGEDEEDKDGEDEGTEDDIYVKFLGWNVTRTANMSRLVKDIDKTWGNDQILGGLPWNIPNFNRSFWAINPDINKNKSFGYQYGDFSTHAKAKKFPGKVSEFTSTYLQENAAPFSDNTSAPDSCSQVIIAAQLVNKKGEPLTLAKWAYNYYTLPGLKIALAKALHELYYSVEEVNGETVYKSIDTTDIKFQYSDPVQEEGQSSVDKENYWVYAVLSDAGENKTWQIGNNADAKPLNTDQVNGRIRSLVNHAMIWKTGMTYYFFDIMHLGGKDTPGYKGVVRNHIYRSTIKSVTGLGVPVFDPDQVIVPESPSDDQVINAEVRVLQWRVVNQDYDLKWE